MVDDDRLQLVIQTNQHFNRYIQQADRKAAVLLSGHLAFIGFFAQLFVGPTSTMTCSGIVAIIFSTVSIASGLYTIFPRFRNSGSNTSFLGNLNWEAVADTTVEDYKEGIVGDNIKDGIESLSINNRALAKVLIRKYRGLKGAMFGSIGAIVFTIIHLL